MARKVKPCGTPAAFKRHLRAGEEPCEACRRAWNEYKRARRAMDKRSAGQVVALAVAEMPPAESIEIDPLQDLLENYRLVCATMNAGPPPQAVPALSRRRQELAEKIAEMMSTESEMSLADQLAALRSSGDTGT